jgi:hypothetical protein
MKNKKHLLDTIFFIFLSIYFFSCAPAYIPNVVNVPQFHNKNEIQAAIYKGSSYTDIQFASAPTKNLGIIINSSFGNNHQTSSDDYHKHITFDGGIGYYKNFGKHFNFEIFGGTGMSLVESKSSFNSPDSNISFSQTTKSVLKKYFIQSDIGFNSKIFSMAFSPRYVFINAVPDNNTLQKVNTSFFEPTLTFKIGYKYAYLSLQGGISIPLAKQFPSWFVPEPLIFSVGLHFKINRFFQNTPMF